MILLGLLAILGGVLIPIPVLVTIGIVLVVIGVVLVILGAVGHPVAGRRWWF